MGMEVTYLGSQTSEPGVLGPSCTLESAREILKGQASPQTDVKLGVGPRRVAFEAPTGFQG